MAKTPGEVVSLTDYLRDTDHKIPEGTSMVAGGLTARTKAVGDKLNQLFSDIATESLEAGRGVCFTSLSQGDCALRLLAKYDDDGNMEGALYNCPRTDKGNSIADDRCPEATVVAAQRTEVLCHAAMNAVMQTVDEQVVAQLNTPKTES